MKMGKKYELIGETKLHDGITLQRIRALIPFGIVMEGELGGWIESEQNLSHDGAAWVCRNAKVYGNARVDDNAQVSGMAQAFGDAHVYGDTQVYGHAQIYGNAQVYGNARISGHARLGKSNDYMSIFPIGSEDGIFTAYRAERGIECIHGIFNGTLDEFADTLEMTHGDIEITNQYHAIISLVRLRFNIIG